MSVEWLVKNADETDFLPKSRISNIHCHPNDDDHDYDNDDDNDDGDDYDNDDGDHITTGNCRALTALPASVS